MHKNDPIRNTMHNCPSHGVTITQWKDQAGYVVGVGVLGVEW